ncbi:hypothetical protein BC827DRAFT_1168205 [Russula dissimulans]|nr:hypothetical protein BC827DRAFT_1168205 [Russula dissimulans]
MSLASLIRLPFFILPLIAHFPAYVMGQLGARLVIDKEETQEQNNTPSSQHFLQPQTRAQLEAV